MEWNSTVRKENGKVDKNGYFEFLGNRYYREDHPLIFSIGGLFTSSIVTLVFIAVFSAIYLLFDEFGVFLTRVLSLALILLGVVMIIGFTKHLVTGDGRPFVKIEREDGVLSVSFFEW